ncbi:MAG: 30S ribosomal protein S3 [Deltaproteobacteria bacterium]|nr:MAG: 30S ribosomal protein S3 [Deltaproteobacteria bacterium]
MGQKTHPYGFRVGITKDWKSRWYARKDYEKFLQEDLKIKDYIKKTMYHAGIADIIIERKAKKMFVYVHTSRPALVIGKKGVEIDRLRKEVQKFTENEVQIMVNEVRRPELSAILVAENVAMQIERRVAYRRAMKKAVTNTLKYGAKGIKIQVAGRLAGAEIARREWYREGRVPLQTIRADIDYGYAVAKTTYGVIGVKVWIYKGDILDREESRQSELA